MREDSVYTRIMADCLGRKEGPVKAKINHIADYFQERNEVSRHEGPQALPLELENSIFDPCFLTIWKGLMTFSKTIEWDKILSSLPPETWLSLIAGHTPRPVKSIPALHQPPNVA